MAHKTTTPIIKACRKERTRINCPSLGIIVTPDYDAAFKKGEATIGWFPSCKQIPESLVKK